MSAGQQNGTATGNRTVISVDAMGGDLGPSAVVGGMVISARKNPEIGFILHGPKATLTELVGREPALAGRVDIRDADGVVSMSDKPSHIMRNGQDTSMWSAIEAVRNREAKVAVSCGNTGALMLVSMLRLRKLPGVNRPAIACLWPSKNPGGFNVMLDVGADIRADAQDLLQYALMGAAYARNGLGIARPRIGILNIGTEEHKGRPEIKEAHDLIPLHAEEAHYEFVGYAEGSDIPSDRFDVIVTDGFTGNVALKTGEGTARLIRTFLREAFEVSFFSKIGAFFALGSLKRLAKRMDPSRANGGVFLGLNGTVVKSHGSADATGVSAAIKLAFRLAQSGFDERLAARVASLAGSQQDDGQNSSGEPT